MALADEEINRKLLEEAKRVNHVRNSSGALDPTGIIVKPNPAAEQWGIISNGVKKFIPYYYIPETMKPIPEGMGFFGGKWHWMRGVQDSSSNYKALEDPKLVEFIEVSEKIDLPIVFEEELAFTKTFVKMTTHLKIIIPHLGMLGGNPIDFLHAFREKENVIFDTALSSSDMIMRFIESIGTQRILFGSDIPFGTMKWELEKVLSLPIGDDEKERILSKNLKKLIGLT
jgi:predicted TIM-barrel fold metal-dependent hydrolase